MSVRPEAVIFDCDGVLVDSERLMNRVFSTMLQEIGLPYTAEETTRRFMGRSIFWKRSFWLSYYILELTLSRRACAWTASA